jgi:hypothetical protein
MLDQVGAETGGSHQVNIVDWLKRAHEHDLGGLPLALAGVMSIDDHEQRKAAFLAALQRQYLPIVGYPKEGSFYLEGDPVLAHATNTILRAHNLMAGVSDHPLTAGLQMDAA